MKTTANPVESALFRSYWDDGLLDVLAGVGVLGIGTAWAIGQPALGAVVPAVLLPFWAPLRRRIVEPRAGYVVFSQARRRRSARGLRTTLGFGVGVLLLAIALYVLARGGATGEPVKTMVPGLPAALLALLALITGLLTGAPRFSVYAGVLVLAAVGTVLLQAEPAAAMLAGGTVVLASGVTLLVRFLKASADHVEGVG